MALAPVDAVVAAVRPAGSHDVLTLSVPDDPVWQRARPGQLVVEPVDPASGTVLSRSHWLAGCSHDVLTGTTLEVVVPAAEATPVRLRLLGPLGRGFAPPSAPVPALLVGHGGDAVPLRWLADLLRARGCPVDVVLVAVDPDGHLDPGSWRRAVRSVLLADDGEAADVVARALDDPGRALGVVYASGPSRIVLPVAAAAGAAGLPSRVAAFSPGDDHACGTGLCGGCELPLPGGGRVRPCAQGPVLPGEQLSAAGRP